MLVTLSDSSEVAAARRAAKSQAQTLGFDEQAAGRSALVATELATNLLKHAGRGQILLDRYRDSSGSGLEILSLDKGPGIADLGRAMEDGYSTAGSMGTGLGAVRRQTDEFAVYSRPGLGTAVMARIRDAKPPPAPATPIISLGAVVAPIAGESVSGDRWGFASPSLGPTLMAVDGSGHGPQAEAAADVAVAAFERHAAEDCVPLIEFMHRALAPTRGGAVAVARIDSAKGMLRFVGVGNIAGALVSEGKLQRMVSHNGVLGHIAPRIREFTYPFKGGVTLLMHSDGLSSKWNLGSYPGLGASHPSLIAGVLFRDHRRERDDASVVVMRVGP
jgi:anti-sigma regulatory factor (Ser/Thr protein kinase)